MKMNPVVHFEMPAKDKGRMRKFYETAFGWQTDSLAKVWPTVIGEMMKNGTRKQIDRVTQAFLPMKKFDIAKLKKAYEEGEGTWQNT